jgi:aryl-alcohol dehydrogenase-like predicted oxidoreductase
MEKRKIGSLEVSVVGLGCNNFGGRIDYEATERVVNATLAAGVNFFDTADIYGKTVSEEYLGRALGARRKDIVLATKFGMEVDENHKGAAPAYIRQACEDSLKRLNTDYIDLYQLHQPDPTVPIADTLATLNELVQSGKVREIGCSNFSPEQLDEAEKAAGSGAKFVSVQNEYSLFHRDPENGVLEKCAELGQGFIPYFPLASGLLTGKYRKGQPLPEGTRIQEGSRWLTEENIEKVEGLIQFAESKGHTILELAVSWLLAKPVVTSVIAGATKPEQIEKNARAADWKLTKADLAEVERILNRQTSAV